MIGFAIFETALGACGIAWRRDAIVGTALPDSDGDLVRSRLRRRLPESEERGAPEPIRQVITDVIRLLGGQKIDLSAVRLALEDAAPFEQQVFAQTLAIPPGETRTYGEVAQAIGQPGAARAVGRALGRNPVPIIVPCHRVLAVDGRSGGFSAPGGVATKMRLLQIEQARRGGQPGLFDHVEWQTSPARP